MRVLSSSDSYLDLRTIVESAKRSGWLRVVADDPEYWCYIMLDRKEGRNLFSRSGSLKVALEANLGKTHLPQQSGRASRGSRSALSQSIHEVHLKGLLAEDLDRVEPGLTLIERQCEAPPVGRIDLLCKDRHGRLVVIEIKKFGATTQSVIDQITRYMGWVKAHLAGGQRVRGIIIVGNLDEKLSYSMKALPDVKVKSFSVSLRDHDPP